MAIFYHAYVLCWDFGCTTEIIFLHSTCPQIDQNMVITYFTPKISFKDSVFNMFHTLWIRIQKLDIRGTLVLNYSGLIAYVMSQKNNQPTSWMLRNRPKYNSDLLFAPKFHKTLRFRAFICANAPLQKFNIFVFLRILGHF